MAEDFTPLPLGSHPSTGAFPLGSDTPVGSVPWPGAQPPTPVSTSQFPPDPPERRSRRGLIVIGAIVLVALAGTGIGVAVASSSGHHTPSSAPGHSDAVPDTATADDALPSLTSDAGTPTVALAPSTASEPALPSVSADIDMEAVSTAPQLPLVARVLDTYYSGINAHNGPRAASVFSPDGNINPQSRKAVAAFQHNIHTSHDDQIVILSITPGSVGTRQGLLVHLTFRSQQAAAYGPHGSTCSDWDLKYRMPYVGGALFLKDSVDATNVDC